MARVRFVGQDGKEFATPDRVSGEDGPEIEIIVCESGEFIVDPKAVPLAFMPRPEPPAVIRSIEVQRMQASAEIEIGSEKWDPSAEEMKIAEEEGAKLRRLLKGYYG